jgi:phage shock protein C
VNRRLYRCHHDKSLAGVASGIAEYFDLDPTVVRVLWIIATLLSGGLAILLYVILAFVMPVEPYGPPAAYAAPAGRGWTTGAPGTAGAAAAAVDPATGETAGIGTADPAADTAGSTGWSTAGAADAAGWNAAASTGSSAWAAYPTGYAHPPRPRGEGRFGLAFGIVLVVFGTIALLGPVFPGWFAGVALGPAFLVALGIALVAVSVRRPSPES